MNETPLAAQTHPSNHVDRYAIYKMLNRMVTFHDLSGLRVKGYVDEVYRDIFAGEIRITVCGCVYRFPEPTVVRANTGELVLAYGDVGKKKDVADKKLFDEMRKGQYRESAKETMSRISPRRTKEARIALGAKKPSRKKPFLMRGIDAFLAATSALDNMTPQSL